MRHFSVGIHATTCEPRKYAILSVDQSASTSSNQKVLPLSPPPLQKCNTGFCRILATPKCKTLTPVTNNWLLIIWHITRWKVSHITYFRTFSSIEKLNMGFALCILSSTSIAKDPTNRTLQLSTRGHSTLFGVACSRCLNWSISNDVTHPIFSTAYIQA